MFNALSESDLVLNAQ